MQGFHIYGYYFYCEQLDSLLVLSLYSSSRKETKMIIIISCTKIILELFLTLLCGINVSMLNILKDKNKSFNFKVIFVLWFVFKMSKSWHIFHFLCAQPVFFKYLSSYTDVFCYEHVDSLAHILAGYVSFLLAAAILSPLCRLCFLPTLFVVSCQYPPDLLPR